MAVKKIRSELMCDGDSNEWGLVIYLGTKSKGAARIKAQRMIRKFNKALKPGARKARKGNK